MKTKTTKSIHIVRRYGSVGGMERYVWELSHALAEQGDSVQIICEKAYQTPNKNIIVHELGELQQKPRWLSMLRFSAKVTAWLNTVDTSDIIVHSHERSARHDVTTFHGPPFAERNQKILDFLSPRIWAWKYLERRELCGKQVQVVLPNSKQISKLLSQHYPCCIKHLNAPAYPGVSESYFSINRTTNKKTIGFMGKEWKRKGLEKACLVVKTLLMKDPDIKFLVAGASSNEIKHLFSSWPAESYELLDWQKTEDFLKKIDLLLHPAITEPFGMVVAEANAAGSRVIISDSCGISPLITTGMGASLPQTASLEDWVTSIEQHLTLGATETKLKLSWKTLAYEHQKTYQDILIIKESQGCE